MSDIVHREGNCVRCGQYGTLAGLAHVAITLETGAKAWNQHLPQGSLDLDLGICETCTWAIAGSWPSAVGMCAAVKHHERRARGLDRRRSLAARTGGRRADDQVVHLGRPAAEKGE